MGRRKKEKPGFHRECIARAAECLFAEKGVAATTMDDIAKAATYSKATLYVYFKNKEDIVGALALKSMKLLLERLRAAIASCENTRERYQAICKEFTCFQAQFPLYFDIIMGEINVDFNSPDALPVEQEIFEVGELIMCEIADVLRKGIAETILRADIQIPQTVFVFWASLSGIIVMAEKKQRYIQKAMGVTKQQFLENAFETLFRSICITPAEV